MTIEPHATTIERNESFNETMSVQLKCFAAKEQEQAFQMSSLALVAVEPSGDSSWFEEHPAQKEVFIDGKQMGFTLNLLSGKEYKFRLDQAECADGDCGCERKNSMVLHFRYWMLSVYYII